MRVPRSSMLVRIEAISARSSISRISGGLSSDPDVVGWLDVASAARLHFPGRYCILKRHDSVRCFKRNRRGLGISSRVRSPKILTSGL